MLAYFAPYNILYRNGYISRFSLKQKEKKIRNPLESSHCRKYNTPGSYWIVFLCYRESVDDEESGTEEVAGKCFYSVDHSVCDFLISEY